VTKTRRGIGRQLSNSSYRSIISARVKASCDLAGGCEVGGSDFEWDAAGCAAHPKQPMSQVNMRIAPRKGAIRFPSHLPVEEGL
jgi:hypothetical protein